MKDEWKKLMNSPVATEARLRPLRWVWAIVITLLASAAVVVGALAAPAEARTEDLVYQRSTDYPVLLELRQTATVRSASPASGALAVSVTADGETQTIYTDGGTVQDVLAMAGLTYDTDDIIEPAPYVKLVDGMRVKLTNVSVVTDTCTATVDFETQAEEDPALPVGETVVETAGQVGLSEHVYRIVCHDNVAVSCERIESRVITEPIDEVLRVGTNENPVVDTPAVVTLQNDDRDHTLPLYEYMVEDVMYMEATAYTHTGNTTATGTMPKLGTIAVNPKQIPYGTLLYVEGYGFGVAEDTGGFRHTGRKQIDLFMDTEDECWEWGRKRNVKVYILKDPETAELAE